MRVDGRTSRIAIVLALACLTDLSFAGKLPFSIDYQVDGVTYSENIPKPDSVLGHEIGTKHTSPEQILAFFQAVASVSKRVLVRKHGSTYEGRPQIHAVVTSVKNHAKLEQIRKNNQRLSDNPEQLNDKEIEQMPAVVVMGYSVHGNEASGSEASMLLLYHLAAGSGFPVESVLENTVLIIDPMLNPDGRSRFVSWVNGNRGRVPTTDPQDREHREPWPGGRGNHYWFDLNRDWLPAQLKETRGRLELFHHWRPQVMTDFHEMGSEATYFFQPGIPSRTNPLTPKATTELTGKIASYHARALDRIGSLYYSEETFDDFYYGKGSTYPDINGGIGILFEQAHSRSLRRATQKGILHYDFTIRNQVATSFSTLNAVVELRKELLANQRDFYLSASKLAGESQVTAYLFSTTQDGRRGLTLVELLRRHRIRVFALEQDCEIDEIRFKSSESVIVPVSQPQIRLIETIMDDVTEFQDTSFYDVSAWTLPRALGVTIGRLQEDPAALLGEEITEWGAPAAQSVEVRSDYAYLMRWGNFLAPKGLYRLQSAGFLTRLLTEPVKAATNGQMTRFESGTIIIPVSQPNASAEQVHAIVNQVAKEDGISIFPVSTGLTESGPDLGSPSAKILELPRVALISGSGTNAYQVGETWFLLNERMGIPVSLIDLSRIEGLKLTNYNTIVLPSGSYGDLSEETVRRIRDWIQSGGMLIALHRAVQWVLDTELVGETFKDIEPVSPVVPYGEVEKSRSAQRISGAIFEVKLDVTHPIAFGHSMLGAVFRSHALFLEPSKTPGANVALYTDEPLLSGYVSTENLKNLKGGASIIARKMGSGSVVLFVDNPNFRAIWHGTSSLFLNALFFGRSL